MGDIDAMAVAMAAWRLGAGRAHPGRPVQSGAGVRIHRRPGEQVTAGEPVFTLYTDTPERFWSGACRPRRRLEHCREVFPPSTCDRQDRAMTTPLNIGTIGQAPKALLHDHLDGGLRPATVLELAEQTEYKNLPVTDVDALATWFRTAAHSGSLERYLEPFAHTVGVMQTPAALYRVAYECVEDLAADNVVYAEVRFAPELHINHGLSVDEVVDVVLAGFADGEKAAAPKDEASRCGAWSPR